MDKNHIKTVYILGAGASSFAGFPLAGDLWKFLKGEMGSTDHQTRISGKRWIDAVEKVIVHLGWEHIWDVAGKRVKRIHQRFEDLVLDEGTTS